MTPELYLTLMSIALVGPVMVGVLFVAFTGRMKQNEEARYLPIREPEHDFWDVDDEPAAEEGGEDR